MKICVALLLAGTLTGWAAPLNPELTTPARSRAGLISPVVLKPSAAQSPIGTSRRWRGAKAVKMIRPAPLAPTNPKVERVDPNPLVQPAITPASALGSTRSTSENPIPKP